MSLIALERAIWNLKIKLEPAILFANGYRGNSLVTETIVILKLKQFPQFIGCLSKSVLNQNLRGQITE